MANKLPRNRRKLEILLSFQCNERCIFCSFAHKERSKDRDFSKIKSDLRDSRKKGIEEVAFTGGEPTIRKDKLLRAVKYARNLGYRKIGIQTNGLMLSYMSYCKKLKKAGVNDWIVSIHGHKSSLHDKLTMTKGAFKKAIKGLKNLKKLDERVKVNYVVCEENYKYIEKTIDKLSSLDIDEFHILFVNPQGSVRYNKELVPKMSNISPYIKEAVKRGEEEGVDVFVFYVPPCIIPKFSDRIAFHENIDLKGPGTEVNLADNRERQRIKFKKCKRCKFNSKCAGVAREYVNIYGKEEFVPITS